MQRIWQWLIGEAGAGWIIGLIGVAWSAYSWVRRERPAHVVVLELRRTKLLEMHPSQHDRVTVLYTREDGAEIPVHGLEQKELVIYNNGTRDIVEPLCLKLRIKGPGCGDAGEQGFWRWFFDDPRCSSRPLEETGLVECDSGCVVGGVTIELAYLNSYPVHKDYVRAYVVSDGQLDVSLWRRQTGRGWSARLISLRWLERWQRRASQIAAGVSGALAVVGVLAVRTGSIHGSLLGHIGLAAILCAAILSSAGPPLARTLCRRRIGARGPSGFDGNVDRHLWLSEAMET